MAPGPLQPFDKHQADTASLTSCGSTLVNKAAEGLTNGRLTKQAYSPAVDSVRGVCAPGVQSADRAVAQGSEDVSANLAWAAVVTRYWGDRVDRFNQIVDHIRPEPGADETAMNGAKQAWWSAYHTFIEDGRTTTAAMLRDGPTQGHMQTAIDVGAMPPMSWDYATSLDGFANAFKDGFLGIWIPPDGTWVDKGIWGGKTLALGQLWYGFAHERMKNWRYMPYATPPYAGYSNSGLRGWFNRSNWVKRYNMPSYTWARDPLTFKRGLVPRVGWGSAARFATNKVFYPLSFAGGAYDQWSRDANRTDLSTGEKVTRSATRGAVKLAGTYAGIELGAKGGAAIGLALGGPPGAIIGGMVGGVIGGVIGSGLADEVADYAVEFVTDPIENTEKLLDSAGNAISDFGDTLSFWD